MFLWLFFALSVVASGQQPAPRGSFTEDSLKIGQPVTYTLSIEYPQELDIVFPDSLYNFSPFELDYKEYFPTRTKAGISYDSARYHLISFEIDSAQVLSLPVFRLLGEDSMRLNSVADTIYLKHLVTKVPDSLAMEAMPLKENTDYLRVDYEFNYPYFIIGLTILIIVVAAVIIFQGKNISNRIKAYKLKRQHSRFLEEYDRIVSDTQEGMQKHAERVVVFWKSYLEKLEPWPYRTLTTRELLTTEHAPELEDAMHAIDRTIYSTRASEVPVQSYAELRKFAEQRFERKLARLQNG